VFEPSSRGETSPNSTTFKLWNEKMDGEGERVENPKVNEEKTLGFPFLNITRKVTMKKN